MAKKYVAWLIGISIALAGFLYFIFLYHIPQNQLFAPPPLTIGGLANTTVLDRAQVIAETNSQRHDNGDLLPLVENTKLDVAAKAKADDMFKNQYFEHTSPDGVDSGTLVKDHGYEYIVSGENLILGNFSSEKDMVARWMASPGHRANILNKRFTDIGVAVVKGVYKGDTVWIGVQEFGLPLTACASPSDALKAQLESLQVNLDAMSSAMTAKKEQGDIAGYNAMVKEYNAKVQEMRALATQYNNQVTFFNNCVAGK